MQNNGNRFYLYTMGIIFARHLGSIKLMVKNKEYGYCKENH